MTAIKQRKDTFDGWQITNPLLESGELGYETDTGRFKVGDGTNSWTARPYLIGKNWEQENEPTNAQVLDTWFRESNNTLYRRVTSGASGIWLIAS